MSNMNEASTHYHDGWKAGSKNAQATVREWHPKCKTCGRYDANPRDPTTCAIDRSDHSDDPDKHYCADHTDFDKEDKR